VEGAGHPHAEHHGVPFVRSVWHAPQGSRRVVAKRLS
jgi:hypothetical protein